MARGNGGSAAEEFDAIVVGAGFAGMYMLHRLRGLGMRAVVLEAGGDVGGTWYWNRYPGARCDVESVQYSYQFDAALQQEWTWTERYAAQPEILAYANHVADRFDLRRDIRFEVRVKAAVFDEAEARWELETGAGERFRARWCVMALGCLSASNLPDFEGRDSFEGPTYHTGHWPHEGVDLAGKRVAVIGTGSSAIQSIPRLAEEAGHLTVFQRTANYSIPAHNRPLEPEFVAGVKAHYPELRARARSMPSGIDLDYRPLSALDDPGRRAAGRNSSGAGRMAGCPSSAASPTCCSRRRPTAPRPISCAPRSPASWTTRRPPACSRRRTSSAASGSAWIRATTRPSTGRTSSWWMYPNGPSRRSRRAACARTGGNGRRTPSSSPPASTP